MSFRDDGDDRYAQAHQGKHFLSEALPLGFQAGESVEYRKVGVVFGDPAQGDAGFDHAAGVDLAGGGQGAEVLADRVKIVVAHIAQPYLTTRRRQLFLLDQPANLPSRLLEMHGKFEQQVICARRRVDDNGRNV